MINFSNILNENFFYLNSIKNKSYTEVELLKILSTLMMISAFVTFTAMRFFNFCAAYGRYASTSYFAKFSIHARTAWILQEFPSVIIPCYALWLTHSSIYFNNFLIILLFTLHYIYRTFVYGFRIRGGKPTPIHLFILGVIFTSWNGYIQSFYHAKFAVYLPNHWYSFGGLFGFFFFLYGMAVNIHSDNILRNLRKPNETSYKIPFGGLFTYVSCPNYFGESVEWFGYALYANTWTAWAFFFFTLSNLVPRAIEHHKWYIRKFDNYPKDRKIIIPFVL